MADSTLRRVRYLVQAAKDAVPAEALKGLPIVGFQPGYDKPSYQSQRITANPMTRMIGRTTHSSSATLTTELSFSDYTDLIAAGLRGTVEEDAPTAGTDRIRQGTATPLIYLEVEDIDPDGNPMFLAMINQVVTSFGVSASEGSMVQATFGFMGNPMTSSDTTQGTGEPLDPPDDEVFPHVESMTLFEEGGSTLTDLLAFDFTVEQEASIKSGGLRSITPRGVNRGRMSISGSLTVPYEDRTLIGKLLDHTESNLRVSLTDTAGNVMQFYIPRLFYFGGSPDSGGAGEDIPLPLTFEAFYDPSISTGMEVLLTAAGS